MLRVPVMTKVLPASGLSVRSAAAAQGGVGGRNRIELEFGEVG